MSLRISILAAALTSIILTALALPAGAGTTTVALKAERAWVRPAPAGLPSSAAYFTVRNTGDTPDVLEAVSTSAGSASLHESMDHGGMMSMRAMGPLAVPAGGVVELKPGGLHVMLEGLKRPLKVGERLPLTLQFKRAGKVAVTAEVRATAP